MASSFGISLSQPRPAIKVDQAAATLRATYFISVRQGKSSGLSSEFTSARPCRLENIRFASWQELVPRLRKSWCNHFPVRLPNLTIRPMSGNMTNALRCSLISPIVLILSSQPSYYPRWIYLSGLTPASCILPMQSASRASGFSALLTLPSCFRGAAVGIFAKEMPCIFCQHRNLNLHWSTGCPFRHPMHEADIR